MSTMKAVRVHEYGDIDALVYEDIAKPEPAADEVLIKIRAAGVNPVDRMIAAGGGRGWLNITLPHTLGCDVAGVVEAVGSEVKRFQVGDEVLGYTSLVREGSYAEYIAAKEAEVTAKPDSLDFINAAALSVGALTSWQAIFDQAGLTAGQKILVHAASGGVGSMAVQLAKAKGAYVIGTTSARNAEFVKSLGADEVIDYTSVKFEDVVKDVDVVFDLIGGETQERSLGILKKGGFIVSAVQPPDAEALKAHEIRGAMAGVQPNARQLEEIVALVEAGKVKTFVEKVMPLSEAKEALKLNQQGRTRGKIVLTVA